MILILDEVLVLPLTPSLSSSRPLVNATDKVLSGVPVVFQRFERLTLVFKDLFIFREEEVNWRDCVVRV